MDDAIKEWYEERAAKKKMVARLLADLEKNTLEYKSTMNSPSNCPSPCFFCHQPGGKQYLSREWDCGYHLECAQQAYAKGDTEADIITDCEDERVKQREEITMTDENKTDIMWFVDAPHRYTPEVVSVHDFYVGSSGQTYALFMLRGIDHFEPVGKAVFQHKEEALAYAHQRISEEIDRLGAQCRSLQLVRTQLEKELHDA